MKKKEKMWSGGQNKPYKKRFCYGCRDIGYFIADCPHEKSKETKMIRTIHRSNLDSGMGIMETQE